MAREFARQFYSSEAWHQCRDGYKKSVGGLCERCLAKGQFVPGEIVHHKIHLTPNNIEIPEISMDWGNLELLCRNCHAEEHGKTKRRFAIDENGKVYATG